jgi:hypothetical protein
LAVDFSSMTEFPDDHLAQLQAQYQHPSWQALEAVPEPGKVTML